jgi:DNA-binding transcriptional LysR family regulator
MVAAGIGYALLSRTAIQRELQRGELTATTIVNPTIERSIYLGTSSRKTQSRATREVAALIRQVARELVAAGLTGEEAGS